MKALHLLAATAALAGAPFAHAQTAPVPTEPRMADCGANDTTCQQLQHANKLLAQMAERLANLERVTTGKRAALVVAFDDPIRYTGNLKTDATRYCASINYPHAVVLKDRPNGGSLESGIVWGGVMKLICYD